MKTVYAILLAFVCYFICYFSFISLNGFIAILLRTSVFTGLYAGLIIYFELTPDVLPVWNNLKNKILRRKRSSL
jgi:hypothetical protein